MIFISYSHADRQMCDELVAMLAPLRRYGGVNIWSDQKIHPGKDWKKEINKALDETSVAVLLVSKAFLASTFIQEIELPYFLDATQKRGVEFLWVLVSDCLWRMTPLNPIQAAHGVRKPVDQLPPARQQTAWRKVGETVNEAWQRYERPRINSGLSGQSVNREEPNLTVLASPARRKTEVFVYSETVKQWWHVGTIRRGERSCKCYIGDQKNTRAGAKFRIRAITTDERVSGMMPPPEDRTQSEDVVVQRK